MPFNNLRWDDIREGSETPPVTIELTRDRMVMIVCGTRDIFPLHHDADFARAAGYMAPAAPIAFVQGLLCRCLTDWTGPAGKIRKLGLTIKAPNYQGDTICASGKVARKYMEKGEHFVDCEFVVTNQDSTVTVEAQATVIVSPQRLT